MLEGLATWFLNNYLGKYLENLNTDQLSIALLQGEVELENVPLRSDALRFVDPSLTVKNGFIGAIKLKIPVARVRSEPWSITMKQVYVVVGPQRFEEYDEYQDDILDQELKLSALDGIESEWRALYDVQRTTSYYPSYSSWMAYGTSFIGTIIENLQVEISDVHIRYEDETSILGRKFSAGITINSLSAQTCDKHWIPRFIARNPTQMMSFKLVELHSFAAYLDTNSEMIGNLEISLIKEKLSNTDFTKSEFILRPVKATAKLERNCLERPLKSRKTPRVKCLLELDQIPLEVTDTQYQCIFTGLRSLHQLRKNRKYWKWRPLNGVHGNARVWWQYAMTCHLEAIHEIRSQNTWTTTLRKCRENVIYVEAFKKYLDNPVTMDKELKSRKDEIDIARSYDELKSLRELAVFYLKRERGLNAKTEKTDNSEEGDMAEHDSDPKDEEAETETQSSTSTLQAWFPLWGGWYADKDVTQTDATFTDPNSSTFEEEILEVLSDEANFIPYKDAIFAQLFFTLNSGTLRLRSADATKQTTSGRVGSDNVLFEFEFTGTKIECETRPRTQSLKFSLTLGGVYVRDLLTKNTAFPLLVSPQNVIGAPLCPKQVSDQGLGIRAGLEGLAKSLQNLLPMASSPVAPSKSLDESLFYFLYERRPFSASKIDHRLHVRSQPLNIVYNQFVMERVADFFKFPEEINRSGQLSDRIRTAALSRMEEAKQRTKEELKKNLNSILKGNFVPTTQKIVWDIVFDLSAPQILVPEQFVDRQALIMVLDFGKLYFTNKGDPSDTTVPGSAVSGEDDYEPEDDEFCTPVSSPGLLSEAKTPLITETSSDSNFDTELSKRFYELYHLKLSDLQVIVGRIKDNWRQAHLKGTSGLHVLDKFSITLQCERRIVKSDDPDLPGLVVKGDLPQLGMHINEDKVYTLRRLSEMLKRDYENWTRKSSPVAQTLEDLDSTLTANDEQLAESQDIFPSYSADEVDESAKLFFLNFCISDLLVDLECRGHSVAQFQVHGLKGALTRRPFDTNIIFSLQNLYLVDTMSLKPDGFEWRYNSNGSSPRSPASPDPWFTTSRQDLLKDRTKLLLSLTSDIKKTDEKSCTESAKIDIITIDQNCPKFESGLLDPVHRFVDVSLCRLNVLFSIQVWVIVFDFFGIGSGGGQPSSPEKEDEDGKRPRGRRRRRLNHQFELDDQGPSQDHNQPESEFFNSEITVRVRSLSVVLNKPEYELAKASASNYISKVHLKNGNFSIEGTLGDFALNDLTPDGVLYSDRFLSRGEHMLKFHFFKYGASDEKLQRAYDATLELRMSSIIYVHTHRFYSEIVTFFNNFNQLQNVMQQIRDAASGFTRQSLPRGTRIKLDIEAGSPLLLIPMSAYSSQILLIDLGLLEVCNTFRFPGDDGTISSESLKTTSSWEVLGGCRNSRVRSRSRSSRRSMSTSSTIRSPKSRMSHGSRRHFSSGNPKRPGGMSSVASLSEDCTEEDFDTICDLPESHRCLLDVLYVSLKSMDLRSAMRRPIDIANDKVENSDDILVGKILVRLDPKQMLAEKCELKLQIERNLDRAFSHKVPDLSIKGGLSKVHATIDSEQYSLVRGLLAYNLGENLDNLQLVETSPNEHLIFNSEWESVWTCIFMDIQLSDVILDIFPHREGPCLARINFFKSRLIFESFSDSSKDVDLVSQEILLSDLRFSDLPMNKRASVFDKILQPMANREERNNWLQAEVHFRVTSETNRFTILLNNMRVMGIFDWWIAVLEYISQSPENPLPGTIPIEPHNETDSVVNKIYVQEEPLYPTTGIISRRAPVVESKGPVFELKLNITDSEVIVVADPSQSDSTTVILRSTTVIAYRPDMVDRPFSCNLNNAEVFSCVLGNEEDSALSIIDPVTINFEIGDRNITATKGLVELASDKEPRTRTAEIQLQQLNIRLSYYDWLMFQAIMKSFPSQARQAFSGKDSENDEDIFPFNTRALIRQLSELGFSKEDCTTALKECNGQLEEAAIWLTANAKPFGEHKDSPASVYDDEESNKNPDVNLYLKGSKISFSSFEVKTSSISICIIDDCREADVPVLDLNLNHLHLEHNVSGTGSATGTVSGFYYNRSLSSWEPLIEPWQCSVNWRLLPIGPSGQSRKLALNLETQDTINFNITSTLLDLYHVVKTNWGNENAASSFDTFPQRKPFLSHQDTPTAFRRRVLYVPFAIKNETGSPLLFCTQTLVAGSLFGPSNARPKSGMFLPDELNWRQVAPEEELTFNFEDRGRGRQHNSQEIKINQIVAKIDGLQEMSPVSVDRVGTFFRKAIATHSSSSHNFDSPTEMRVVFDVKLVGSARKLITVRSALQMENKLPHPVKIKLENTAFKIGEVFEFDLQSGQKYSIPLNFVWALTYVRPLSENQNQWNYSDRQINWYHIMTRDESSMEIHSSPHMWNRKLEPYRFCVSVRRHHYPIEKSPKESSAWIQPGHTISFVPAILLVNLLPCYLRFKIKDSDGAPENIEPGKESCLAADISQRLTLSFFLDVYAESGDLVLPPSSGNFDTLLRFKDHQNRALNLNVRVTTHFGGAAKIVIYSSFWIVNRTGLPLLFTQDDCPTEAPGQDVENEIARMATPLMFAFSNDDADGNISNKKLKMRIGNGLHVEGKSEWCHPFQLQNGSQVRRIRVANRDTRRVDWVYNVGIEVRNGKGRYRNTQIVTISPRFQLHNLSPHKIQYSQRCFATSFQDPEAEATHLQAFPQSSLAFHWPRLDRDQLLCIRLIDHACDPRGPQRKVSTGSHTSTCSDDVSNWSGGFEIEKVDSFHVTVRHLNGRFTFVRVEISMIGATFCIVLTDAGNFPPPFRIDNFSEVPISYIQTGINDESLRLVVKPHHSKPFALDEPTLPPHLTCMAPGGSVAIYDMNLIGEGSRLTYENFIYIVMTTTFTEPDLERIPNVARCLDVTNQQLVLDVDGTRVFLAPKEPGKRSQLWRMTSNGMLQHEGSSPPQDPRLSPKAGFTSLRNVLVLDIAGPAVQPQSYVPLMLRKPDDRRKLTQTWRFTEEGRLMCNHRGLYVQAKDGFRGIIKERRHHYEPGKWQKWSDLVLGPALSVCFDRTPEGVPVEQAISRQRLRPGSGFLTVKVTTDGPTRVLQILDVKKKNVFAKLEERDWILINETKRPQMITAPQGDDSTDEGHSVPNAHQQSLTEIQLVVVAKGGIGVSLVSRTPAEELIYAFMSFVIIDYQSSATHRSIDGSVQNVQIDCQLGESQSPVILYLSPTSKSDESRHMPAINFSAHKVIGQRATTDNAEIFKHLIVTIKNITLNLEEELLCKVLKFAGFTRSDEELERIDETAYEAQHALIMSATTATRYYFGTLKLVLNQVKLSVTKSNKLSPDLQAVKRKLGLTLISFEDANINLRPFVWVHPFEHLGFLTNSVFKHYQEELLSQSVLILGSTDFLGNPNGFFNDLSKGVSGLVSDGDVSGLIKNVAHGAANSAAKVTGSLSYGISKATVDERYDEKRLMLRRRRGDKSKEYLVAGVKGLAFGVLGGLTSIITQPYEGFNREGVGGFFTGIGWGLVGTISKPAIGVLDFASGAATAVKESSRSVSRQLPQKLRPARVVLGPGGSLPIYSRKDGIGQELLEIINGHDSFETFVGHERLRQSETDLQILITSERLMVFSLPPKDDPKEIRGSLINEIKSVLTVHHSELVCARIVSTKEGSTSSFHDDVFSQETNKFYVELVLKLTSHSENQKRPQIRCDSEKLAKVVVHLINYARGVYDEMLQAVMEESETDES